MSEKSVLSGRPVTAIKRRVGRGMALSKSSSTRKTAAVMIAWLWFVLATAGTVWAIPGSVFKLRYPLLAAGGGSSYSGTNALALPYRLPPTIANAKDLMDDIGFANVANVQRYVAATNSIQTYTGRKAGGQAFVLVPGEGYFVRMNTTTTYTIIGAHDDSVQIALRAADGGVTSANGTNFFSPPYNLAAGDAKALMDDIGFVNVANVQRFLGATDSVQTYTGRKSSGPNFPIVRGEAYFVKMNTTVNYTPSHY